jgi:DNA N-6-adenine-methyltransferase (Dam)
MSNEWYTPAKYIEAARQVMGSIDLDPASCALANQTVRAARYYTQEDNGLAQEWFGNVWLNPPYGLNQRLANAQRSSIRSWVNKAIRCYEREEIEQAILLTTVQATSQWFHSLLVYPHCFAMPNIRFYVPNGRTNNERCKTQGHFFGSIFVYLGSNEQRFIEVFSKLGSIAKAIDVKAERPRQLELVS